MLHVQVASLRLSDLPLSSSLTQAPSRDISLWRHHINLRSPQTSIKMSYLTPPSTGRKKRGVFNKYRQPEYYEDIYGEMNKDEKLEGRPDRCDTESESESDSEDIEGISKRKAFQQTPKSLKRKRGVPDVDDGKSCKSHMASHESTDHD